MAILKEVLAEYGVLLQSDVEEPTELFIQSNRGRENKIEMTAKRMFDSLYAKIKQKAYREKQSAKMTIVEPKFFLKSLGIKDLDPEIENILMGKNIDYFLTFKGAGGFFLETGQFTFREVKQEEKLKYFLRQAKESTIEKKVLCKLIDIQKEKFKKRTENKIRNFTNFEAFLAEWGLRSFPKKVGIDQETKVQKVGVLTYINHKRIKIVIEDGERFAEKFKINEHIPKEIFELLVGFEFLTMPLNQMEIRFRERIGAMFLSSEKLLESDSDFSLSKKESMQEVICPGYLIKSIFDVEEAEKMKREKLTEIYQQLKMEFNKESFLKNFISKAEIELKEEIEDYFGFLKSRC